MSSFDEFDNAQLHDTLEDHSSNHSDNRPFSEVVDLYASRRKVLKGGLALAATTFFASPLALAGRGGKKGPNKTVGQDKKNGLVAFDPVKIDDVIADTKVPMVSPDYEYQVIIPWGQSLDSSITPSYDGDPGTRPTAEQQANQIGIGHDGMWFFPKDDRSDNGVLAINHEFGRNTHVTGKGFPESLEDVRLSQHAHGVAVVELVKSGGKWQLVDGSPLNRRVHVNTDVEFSGPVANSELIDAARGGFRGTVNNCSNGYTPWGTYLTCEENFNGYFGATGDWDVTEARARYGFSDTGFGYGWHVFDERFDMSSDVYPNEENRFGWVVEVDPMNPASPPVKRSALGRFKHEGVALTVGRGGRVVCYMGDDQRFDYIYKFVSDSNWKSMRARGMSPLDHGKLYVARFNEDGTGDWLELTIDNPALAAKFSSQEEVLVYARIAADILGATPMDRPEWTTVAPNGDVYCTLTNNSRRTEADAANPLAPNNDGHIIRWHDSDRHVGETFVWDIFILSKDTHADGDERTFSDPDGLWIDPDGRMFIQTDGGQPKGLNNQMLVCSTYEGVNTEDNSVDIRRLLSGVASDEITGLTVTPDRRTLFCNTQHPGNGNPEVTNFPAATDGETIPRDCTFVLVRKDGGIVGS